MPLPCLRHVPLRLLACTAAASLWLTGCGTPPPAGSLPPAAAVAAPAPAMAGPAAGVAPSAADARLRSLAQADVAAYMATLQGLVGIESGSRSQLLLSLLSWAVVHGLAQLRQGPYLCATDIEREALDVQIDQSLAIFTALVEQRAGAAASLSSMRTKETR